MRIVATRAEVVELRKKIAAKRRRPELYTAWVPAMMGRWRRVVTKGGDVTLRPGTLVLYACLPSPWTSVPLHIVASPDASIDAQIVRDDVFLVEIEDGPAQMGH